MQNGWSRSSIISGLFFSAGPIYSAGNPNEMNISLSDLTPPLRNYILWFTFTIQIQWHWSYGNEVNSDSVIDETLTLLLMKQ